uniref:Uncharacterized protein n=1 Tax=Meloidogyne floridensis TaxID=298350 RepID=A0A915NIK9_9BILA
IVFHAEIVDTFNCVNTNSRSVKGRLDYKLMPFAASGLHHSINKNTVTTNTKIKNGKDMSRIITTNIKIHPFYDYSNPVLGSYSSAYVSAGPKFKAYKFGQDKDEYEYLKQSKFRPSKSSKSLIERFIEEDEKEEKLKSEDLSRKNVVQRIKTSNNRDLGLTSENKREGLAIALESNNHEKEGQDNQESEKKNYKIVANKMKNQMPEAQTIIEEPVVSEEKIIENSSENKSDSSEYYSVNSEYYSANSESEEESPEEFERSLTADQVKNENKGRLKRFYSEQSPPRKKMIEERFEFTPKQDSVGTSGINKIEKVDKRVNDEQSKGNYENNTINKEDISTKILNENVEIKEKNKQNEEDKTMISENPKENISLNSDQIKNNELNHSKFQENKQLNKDKKITKRNKRKNKQSKNPLGVNKANGIKHKRQSKIRDKIHNILFKNEDKNKDDLYKMIKENGKKGNQKMGDSIVHLSSDKKLEGTGKGTTKSKNKAKSKGILKGFKVKTKGILGGLRFGKKNKKGKTINVKDLKKDGVVSKNDQVKENNQDDFEVEENNNGDQVESISILNKNEVGECSSKKEGSSKEEENSSKEDEINKVIEEVKILPQNNIVDAIQEEEEIESVEELVPKPSQGKIAKNEQFNKLLEESSPKTISFSASPFRHIKSASNTIWAEYEFSPSLAIKEADMLPIVPLLFKTFESRKHNNKHASSISENVKNEKKILHFHPQKFFLGTVLKQAFRKGPKENISFEQLEEFFKNVEIEDWEEIEETMNMEKIEMLFDLYTDFEKLKEKDNEIHVEKYKELNKEQIKEYPLEDQYFWLIIKMLDNEKSFRKILEKKFVYEKKLEDAKEDIKRLESKLKMPIFEENEKEFVEKLIKTVLHIINLLNWKSGDKRQFNSLDLNNLPDYLKRKNQNTELKYKDIDIVHLIIILLRNKIEGQSENVLNSRLKNLKDKFYERGKKPFVPKTYLAFCLDLNNLFFGFPYENYKKHAERIDEIYKDFGTNEESGIIDDINSLKKQLQKVQEESEIFKWLGFYLAETDVDKRCNDRIKGFKALEDGFTQLLTVNKEMENQKTSRELNQAMEKTIENTNKYNEIEEAISELILEEEKEFVKQLAAWNGWAQRKYNSKAGSAGMTKKTTSANQGIPKQPPSPPPPPPPMPKTSPGIPKPPRPPQKQESRGVPLPPPPPPPPTHLSPTIKKPNICQNTTNVNETSSSKGEVSESKNTNIEENMDDRNIDKNEILSRNLEKRRHFIQSDEDD